MAITTTQSKKQKEEQLLRDINNLAYYQLDQSKSFGDKLLGVATAGKTTAAGDEITFNPLLKKWEINLAPMTKGIVGAQQSEQYKSLTEDAGRNRDAARRADKRAISGDEEFQRAFNSYRFRPKRDEGSYIADATRGSLLARKNGSNSALDGATRALMRGGNTSRLGSLAKSFRGAEADEFESTLLNGKSRGRADYQALEGADENRMQQELAFLKGIADSTPQSAVRFGNDADQLTSMASGGMDNIMSSLSAAQGQSSDAMNKLISTLQSLVAQASKG